MTDFGKIVIMKIQTKYTRDRVTKENLKVRYIKEFLT